MNNTESIVSYISRKLLSATNVLSQKLLCTPPWDKDILMSRSLAQGEWTHKVENAHTSHSINFSFLRKDHLVMTYYYWPLTKTLLHKSMLDMQQQRAHFRWVGSDTMACITLICKKTQKKRGPLTQYHTGGFPRTRADISLSFLSLIKINIKLNFHLGDRIISTKHRGQAAALSRRQSLRTGVQAVGFHRGSWELKQKEQGFENWQRSDSCTPQTWYIHFTRPQPLYLDNGISMSTSRMRSGKGFLSLVCLAHKTLGTILVLSPLHFSPSFFSIQ